MKRHKSIFQEFRQTLGNNADKAIIRYYEMQGADKAQLEEIKGNKQYWK
jgi:hypothetical protein